jgi:anti-anti-sigma regulatory factor
MLRITVTTLPERTTVILEGRLTGAWVAELAASWRDLIVTRDARSILIHLDGVTFIDAAGKDLIRAMHARGASLAATELMARSIMDETPSDGDRLAGARNRTSRARRAKPSDR